MPTDPLPSDIRLAVAQQPTVAGSIMAFLRAVTSTIYGSVNSGDPAAAKALADHISGDPGAWADAIVANTPEAPMSAGLGVKAPSYMAGTFASHGVQTEQQKAAESEADGSAQKQRDDEAAAKKADEEAKAGATDAERRANSGQPVMKNDPYAPPPYLEPANAPPHNEPKNIG